MISNTTKVINKNKFRNISIPRRVSGHKLWFLAQQRTIWSNVTSNTTMLIGRHKTIFFFCNLGGGLDLSLETSASTSELLSSLGFGGLETNSVTKTGLILDNFSSLPLNSTNSCYKLLFFSTSEAKCFFKITFNSFDSSKHTPNASFSSLTFFNSS